MNDISPSFKYSQITLFADDSLNYEQIITSSQINTFIETNKIVLWLFHDGFGIDTLHKKHFIFANIFSTIEEDKIHSSDNFYNWDL